MKDRFTIGIKNVIDKGRIDPPTEAWNNISQKLDIENSWQNIDRKLDIDTVWGRIDHQLHTDARMKTYEKMSYVPIIALLLLLSWLGVKNEIYDEPINQKPAITQQIMSDQESINKGEELEQKDQINKPKSENTIQKRKNEDDSQKIRAKSEDKSTNISEELAVSSSQSKTSIENLRDSNIDYKSATNVQNLSSINTNTVEFNNTPLGHLNSIPTGLLVNFENINRKAPDFIRLAEDSIIKESKNIQWFYGIGLSGNRTWLNDNRLKRASEGSSLYSAIASNNLSFKINAGLELNQNWSIQTDLTILGSIDQSYGEYINGKYKEGNINVNYNGLQIGLKRELPNLFSVVNLLNKQIIGGGYANHIYQVTQNENIFIINENNQLQISDRYKKVDFGVWGGIEMFYRLNDSYLLGSALHYKYGLNNIYKGNNAIPAYLRETNTSELSLSIILRRNSK